MATPAAAGSLRHGALVEIGMNLDLVGDDRRLARRDRLLELRDVLVADADEARLACSLDSIQHLDLIGDGDLVGRPVQEKQIDLIDLQLVQALIDGSRELIGAVVVDPDLGGQEQVFAARA